MKEKARAEIKADGLVQGVGFRYFVMRNAKNLGLNGFVKNLYSGEVKTVIEGEKEKIEELHNKIKSGPSRAQVNNTSIVWSDNLNEFINFEVRR